MGRIFIAEPTEIYSATSVGYIFKDWNGKSCHWPRELGANLGQAGAFNFFLRCGFKVFMICSSQANILKSCDLVVIDIPYGGTCDKAIIHRYMRTGCRIMFTGDFMPVASFFGVANPSFVRPQRPYNCFGYSHRDRSTPLQPPNWGAFLAPDRAANPRLAGSLFEIAGDRLSPQMALRFPIPDSFLFATDITEKGQLIYVNGFIFSALQAWLQGQEDLTPWLAWNSRLHWLDDYVDMLFDAFVEYGAMATSFERITEIGSSTICMRHDVDDSTDYKFAELECEAHVNATYALLDDKTLPSWLDTKKRFPNHEYAFHYSTISPKHQINKYLHHVINMTPARVFMNAYLTGAAVIGDGKLVDQVRAARSHGISIKTLHRHFSYLPYPEIIDALHGVYESNLGVIGSGSYFRSRVYRWGAHDLDGETSTVGQWPDSQFPFWMPFRLAHAAHKGAILPGWECTLLMESEPEFIQQMLKTRHRNLPHKMLMLCYHPAHTDRTWEWLKSIITICRDSGYKFERYCDFLSALNSSHNQSVGSL